MSEFLATQEDVVPTLMGAAYRGEADVVRMLVRCGTLNGRPLEDFSKAP